MSNPKNSSLNPDAAENVYLEQTVLNAARVGSVDTSVLRFDGAPVVEGSGIAVVTTEENGTIYTIAKPGVYTFEFEAQTTDDGEVMVGLSKDAAAGTLATDPLYTAAGIVKSQRAALAAATRTSFAFSASIRVSGAEAQAGCLLRAHGTDPSGAGGGAPALLELANVRVRITRENGFAA